MKQTLAAVLYDINLPLKIMPLKIPALKPGQVLVKIAYTSICRTQLNEMQGLKGKDKFLPHTLGHEGSGVVEEIGAEVTKVSPGDRVVMSWLRGSGMEVPSCVYESEYGSVNSGAISTFLFDAVISENRVIPIKSKTSLRTSALFGCAVPTGAGSVINIANPKPSESIAIFGLGGVGQCAAIAAKNFGVSTIIGIDKIIDRLSIAHTLGVTDTINPIREDVSRRIFEITQGEGVDYAIEATGCIDVMETAFSLVKPNGGKCIISGNPPLNQRLSLNPFDFIKGRNIIGSWGGSSDIDRDILTYEEWLASDMLPLEKLMVNEYKFKNINEALKDFDRGDVLRPLIKVHDEFIDN